MEEMMSPIPTYDSWDPLQRQSYPMHEYFDRMFEDIFDTQLCDTV